MIKLTRIQDQIQTKNNINNDINREEFNGETDIADADAIKTSIDDIIKGNKYSKIPTSSAPIGKATTTTGSSVIPISAGLSAAAAVGLGAKALLDKKAADEEEEEDVEKWQGEGSVDIAPDKVEEEDVLITDGSERSLQSQIIESVTGERS